jgi:DNA-binding NtrC family response regulator
MTHTPSAFRGRLELVLFTWSGEPQRHRLPVVGQVRIGRDPGTNDISIQDPSVSANHAILTVDSRIQIQDLGSKNGTIVRKGEKDVEVTKTDCNDQRRFTGETVVVEPGNRIIFGSVMTVVRLMQLPSNTNADDGGTWRYPPIVRHPAMQKVYDDARTVARSPSRACVLLLGETGVGKDVLARAIHAESNRAKGRFVAVNAGLLGEAMFAREMFGHKKGTFTDAKTDEPGLFEVADGGTLFLDEIGDLSLPCQTMLLRVLDDRQVRRMGAAQSKFVNVRVIAATNKRLDECVAQGTFRKDLYHRLQGFELEIPPLRSRPADIIPLAEAFVEDECRMIEQSFVPRLSGEAAAILEGYDFPGNVRELRAAITRAVAYCSGKEILPEHLPKSMREENDKTDPMLELPFAISDAVLDETSEERRLKAALDQCGGNAKRAAALLGISLRTIFNWLNKYDLPRSRKGAVDLRVRVGDPRQTR